MQSGGYLVPSIVPLLLFVSIGGAHLLEPIGGSAKGMDKYRLQVVSSERVVPTIFIPDGSVMVGDMPLVKCRGRRGRRRRRGRMFIFSN